jgi:hypothetical protein
LNISKIALPVQDAALLAAAGALNERQHCRTSRLIGRIDSGDVIAVEVSVWDHQDFPIFAATLSRQAVGMHT